MRILHCCIANFFIDNYNYQENILPRQNYLDGNEVRIIASTFSFEENDNNRTIYLAPCEYTTKEGIPVIRRNYDKIINRTITNKIRKVSGFYDLICEFDPDVILFHGTSSVEINTLIKYKKNKPRVKIYIDSHADYYTSGTNWLSRKLLHGIFYRYFLTKSIPYIEKFFYVSVGCGKFMKEIYKLPDNKLEFYSLGGFIPTEKELDDDRAFILRTLGIGNDKIVLLQAGKFDAKKKIVEALKAFVEVKSDRFVYVLIGSLSDDVKNDVSKIVKQDNRIKYLGWMDGDQLDHWLNGCDIYIQPGKVSAIAQNAICRQCAVVLNDLEEYRPFVRNNGWLINSPDEIITILESINRDPNIIKSVKKTSSDIAKEYFDYKHLANRMYV